MNSTPYRARIRFLLAPSERLKSESECAAFDLGGFTWYLKPFDSSEGSQPTRIMDTNHLVLSASGFSCRDSSQEHGMRMKAALSLCGAMLRIGIDVGRDRATGGVSNAYREELGRRFGVLAHNDVHGLLVYPEQPPPMFVSATAQAIASRDFSRFCETLREAHELTPRDSKVQLALEFYALSHFQTSLAAQLLFLVTAVEVLADPQASSEAVQRFLDKLINQAQRASQITEEERRSLSSRLAEMRRESIRQACRRLVEQHLGSQETRFFDKCYQTRSRILHDGNLNVLDELTPHIGELDQLVAEVIVSSVKQ